MIICAIAESRQRDCATIPHAVLPTLSAFGTPPEQSVCRHSALFILRGISLKSLIFLVSAGDRTRGPLNAQAFLAFC
jgi:hypothetical protein